MIRDLLEEKYKVYNRIEFIETDPIFIPHLFSRKENIEIAGFFAATFAWGQRPVIIRNSEKLLQMMDNDPFNFILSASETDLENMDSFNHRTFNNTDLKYFIISLRNIYLNHGGLESIFNNAFKINKDIRDALKRFHQIFFELPYPVRTQKHLANIANGSSAKRLNMFLRWMVRKDNRGVDFGLWKKIPASALYLPLDLHSGNTARELGLLERKVNDWKAVEEVTDTLRMFDPDDPAKYDFALFGMGIFANKSNKAYTQNVK